MSREVENPESEVSISFAWSWKSKDVTDLSIDGLYLDEYESDDLFVAVRDALTEWLTPSTPENTATPMSDEEWVPFAEAIGVDPVTGDPSTPENTAGP